MPCWRWYQLHPGKMDTVPVTIPVTGRHQPASHIAVIVQARMGSTRLPGKVMMDLAGRPVIGHLLDRLRRIVPAEKLIVTTGKSSNNDPLASYCQDQNIAVHRGDEENVAERMVEAASIKQADAFMRISADSPFLSTDLLANIMQAWQTRPDSCRFFSNVHHRSFPKGQSVEIVDLDFYRNHQPANDPKTREHVTSFLYDPAILDKSAGLFVARDPAINHLQTSIDTRADFLRATRLAANGLQDDTGLEQLISLAESDVRAHG